MVPLKPLTIHTHGAIVLALAPLLMVVPYLMSAGTGIGLACFFLGATLIGLALNSVASDRMIPLSALRDLDWAIGITLISLGVLSGALSGDLPTSIFLVVFGAAQIALTAVTRYSARGA